MGALRLLAVLLVIAVIGCFVAYVFTGKRKYLGIGGRLLKYGIVCALVFFGLLFLERIISTSL